MTDWLIVLGQPWPYFWSQNYNEVNLYTYWGALTVSPYTYEAYDHNFYLFRKEK